MAVSFLGRNGNCGGRNEGAEIWQGKSIILFRAIEFIFRYPSGNAEKANDSPELEFPAAV